MVTPLGHIFVAYASVDRQFTERLVKDLANAGVDIWFDRVWRPGNQWSEVVEAIESVLALLVIASPDSRHSEYVINELAVAYKEEKPILVIWASGDEWLDSAPTGMENAEYIDARGDRYDQAVKEIVARVNELTEAAPAAPQTKSANVSPVQKQTNIPQETPPLEQQLTENAIQTQLFRVIVDGLDILTGPGVGGTLATILVFGEILEVITDSRTEADGHIWWEHAQKPGWWSTSGSIDGSQVFMEPFETEQAVESEVQQQSAGPESPPSSSGRLPSHVYIAYSGDSFRDRFTDQLLGQLQGNGYETWIDYQNSEFTDDWRNLSLPFIRTASALIVVVSPRSMQSGHVAWEAERAEEFGVPIIPVIAIEADVRDMFQTHNPIDLTNRQTWPELFNRLDNIPIRPPVPPTPVPNHVYIAYSVDSYEDGFTDQLLRQLQQNGFQTWIDYQNSQDIDDWRSLVLPDIETAGAMIVVLSPYSTPSNNVRWETEQALEFGVPIVPVIAIQSIEIPEVYQAHDPIDLTSGQTWPELFDRLNRLPVRLGPRSGAQNDRIAEEDFLTRTEILTRRGARNDRVAQEDQLEFKHYVFALADLITSRATEPPLTVGIFGSWGMGKSFLLDHIQRRIEKRDPYREEDISCFGNWDSSKATWWHRPYIKLLKTTCRQMQRFGKAIKGSALWIKTQRHKPWHWVREHWFDIAPPGLPDTIPVEIVSFNAWEYSATEVIWPGLVRKIMDRSEKEVGILVRLRARVTRNAKQQRQNAQLWLLMATGILIALVIINRWSEDNIVEGMAAIGAFGLTAGFVKLYRDLLADPVGKWITTLFEKNDYGTNIGYMEEIKHDLDLLDKGLARRNKRVLVVIDDLDRCEPEKAVQMLQAVKLLLNFDGFIVILGIDARIITRAVEKHYSDLLGPAGASGYEYLDKIIQIPFRIPKPNQEEIENFVEKQMHFKGESDEDDTRTHENGTPQPVRPPQPNDGITPTPPPAQQPASGTATAPQPEPPPQPEPEIPVETRRVPFTEDEREAFKALSRMLRPNPRHLKRLINIYRLVKSLAEYKEERFFRDNPQTGINWVVLCGQWPYTMHCMLRLYDEILEDEDENDEMLIQQDAEVLKVLYDLVKKQLSKDKRAKLDYDPDMLLWMLKRRHCKSITREILDKLRQYTMNFNPAVEAEIETPIEVPPQDQAETWLAARQD